jgi:anaerobic dimethyl sulfoxide reductase subunit B (iron-sulfur subunit)
MVQHGFFFDQSRCSGCHACTVACKSWNELPPGPLKYLKIYEYEKGSFPEVRIHVQWVPCYHCEEPACIESCPSGAISKEDKYGAVLIDSEKCTGCRMCYEVCPYGAPVFESDAENVIAQKCDMCIDRLEMGLKPVCVLSCPNRALDFGPLTVLKTRYGDRMNLEDLPDGKVTRPAVVFKPHMRKQQLVSYDADKAVKLMMKREPLPPVFTSPDDVKKIPDGLVGRNKLVIKQKSVEELMHYTRNDEG